MTDKKPRGCLSKLVRATLAAAALGAAGLYVTDKVLESKFERHPEEKKAVKSALEQLAGENYQSVSDDYKQFLQQEGFDKAMERITVTSYNVFRIQESGDLKISHYIVHYTDKKGKQHKNIGSFVMDEQCTIHGE